MDTKYPSNLDPKLREAYDRVMGTGAAGSKPTVHQAVKHEDPAPAPVVHTAAHDDKPTVVHLDGDTQKEKKAEKSEVANPTKSSPTTAILLGVVGVLFFIGYAIFWAQIFGFNIIPTS